MRKIRTVLVEDEAMQRRWLTNLLEAQFPEVELVGIFESVEATLAYLLAHPNGVDLAFMDIELQDGNAFHLLNMIEHIPFEVIFLTAHDRFALHAIKVNALDYLIKPIRVQDVKEAIRKFEGKKGESLMERHGQRSSVFPHDNKKLVVPLKDGSRFIPLSEILYCAADVNYTRFHFVGGSSLLSAKTLKEYDNLLEGYGFLRIHQSYLVNVRHIVEYKRTKTPQLVLCNGTTLRVARSKKEFISEMLKGVW